MTHQQLSTPDRSGAGRYEIRLAGHLDAHWTAWFDGMAVTYENDETTLICGSVADQAALHGLLQRVRDLGLPLISVELVDDDLPDDTNPSRDQRTTERQGDPHDH